jgi:phosphoglycerate dehydrogenase-like enzyme
MRSAALSLLAILCTSALAVAAVPDIVAELGLEESAERVDQRPGWSKPRKILVRTLPGFPGVEWLQPAAPGVKLVPVQKIEDATAQAEDADAVLGWCDEKLLGTGRRIRWVQWYFAGVERCVGIPALQERGILVTNMQRAQSPVIAEHAIAMVLALARGLDLAVAQQSKRAWNPEAAAPESRMRVLKGKTMLIAGLGGIGTEVARRAHALGMRVIATRASDRQGPEFVSHVGRPDELPKLAAEADVVVNALPSTKATQRAFDARVFARMKRSALFVNVGRGATVDTDDLAQALANGKLAGAGLDVTDPEPLPPDHPLWQAPNVIITPHVASDSDLGNARVWEVVRENLRRYVAGEKMLSVVDVERGY